MRYKEILVGRSETLPIGEFHSLKLYNQVAVELSGKESVGRAAERLHMECKKMLEAQKRLQGLLGFLPTSIERKQELMENGGKVVKKQKKKSRKRNQRNVEQLIKDYNIHAVRYANYLRAKEQISYQEWRALQEHFAGEG